MLLASVIVPAHNAQAGLRRCLAALSRQSLPRDRYEVIVVDDGSTDGTARIAEEAGVRVLRQPSRHGPAAARNLGARASHADFLVFTDSDCEPVFRFLEALLAPLIEDPTFGGSKGTYVPAQTALVARFVQCEYEDRYRRTARVFRRWRTIDFVDTYAAAFRRDVFEAAGGFDETFTMPSVEDQELSFRIAAAGRRLAFVPEASVAHTGHAASVRAYVRKKFRIAFWKLAVLRRHPARALTDSHTPQTLKVQIVLAAVLIASGLAAAVARAPALAMPAGLAATAFLITAAPFSVRLIPRDPGVALIAPFMMFVRAVALGAGMIAGVIRASSRAAAAPRDRRTLYRLEQLVWLLFLSDLLVVVVAMRLSYLMRFRWELLALVTVPRAPYVEYLKPTAVLLGLLPLFLSLFELYRADEVHSPPEVLSATAKAVTLATVIVLAFGFYYRSFSYSRLVFAYNWAITIAACTGTRLILRRVVYARYAAGKDLRRALVVGDPSAHLLPGRVATDPAFGIEIVGWTRAADARGTLAEALERRAIDEVLIAEPALTEEDLLSLIEACEMRHVDVRLVPPTYGLLISPRDLASVQGVALLRVDELRYRRLGAAAKRTFDIVVSAPLMIVLAPLLAVLALAIRASSPGPAVFSQVRAGQYGRPFRMLKFRTMVVDAEQRLDQLLDIDQIAEPVFKLRDDPRVTAIGRLLRRFSLDELPQLWNVLKGDMSLVGPRPDEERVVRRYGVRERRRLKVKPGMTGWQQVEARGALSTLAERVRLDVYYIRNQSVLFDILILLRTIWAVIGGRGAS